MKLCLFAFLFLFVSSPALALVMSGSKIKLNLQFKTQSSSPSAQTGQNLVTPLVESGNENLELEKPLYSISYGYNKADVRPVGLGVTPKTLNFGTISPTSAVTRLQTIAVQKGPAPSYNLFISENHPPQDASGSGKFIPNTTGDKDKITIGNSGYWINPLTYGFGYRARLKDKALSGFEKEDTYKQFPSIENGNPRQPLFAQESQDQELTIILKININNTQAETVYQNDIYYTLIPSL